MDIQVIGAYLAAGLFSLFVAIIIDRVKKIGLFWAKEDYSEYSRSYFEFAMIFLWPLIDFGVICWALFKVVSYLFGKIIPKCPVDKDDYCYVYSPDIYDHLIKNGINTICAGEVVDELENI
jgi:hypothetical protein